MMSATMNGCLAFFLIRLFLSQFFISDLTAFVIQSFPTCTCSSTQAWWSHSSLSRQQRQSFLSKTVLKKPSCVVPRKSFLFSTQREDDGIEAMRKLLEASWNAETMGSIPTNADAAAETAANSVVTAIQRGLNLCYVDLLLPQYDIRQGTNLYDEVRAVEFCIGLAINLHQMRGGGKSMIVVKDDKTINIVKRVLDARERSSRQDDAASTLSLPGAVDNQSDGYDEDDEVEFYNDFADFGSIGDDSSSIDSFREKLISTWDNPTAEPKTPKAQNGPPPLGPDAVSASKNFRLVSMLGDASSVRSGSDMMDSVIKAVAAYAQPKDDEDTIIILSAASDSEMIGVRSLVAKYQQQGKTIVLVNCSLDPIPRELISAQTVYSIQPLIARPVQSEQNLFAKESSYAKQQQEQKQAPSAPKIVVMRRFPRDWEVFVDDDSTTGKGFELACTIPANQVPKKGPSLEFIASCVKTYLQSRQQRLG